MTLGDHRGCHHNDSEGNRIIGLIRNPLLSPQRKLKGRLSGPIRNLGSHHPPPTKNKEQVFVLHLSPDNLLLLHHQFSPHLTNTQHPQLRPTKTGGLSTTVTNIQTHLW